MPPNYQQPQAEQPNMNYAYPSQSPNDKLKRLIMIAGLFIGIFVMILVIVSYFSRPDTSGPDSQLTQVVTRQERILKLIEDYKQYVRGGEALNKTASIAALVQTDMNVLEDRGFKSNKSSKELTASNIEEELTDSTASTNFDETFIDALQEEIDHNIKSLEIAHKATTKADFKAELETIIANEKSLLD